MPIIPIDNATISDAASIVSIKELFEAAGLPQTEKNNTAQAFLSYMKMKENSDAVVKFWDTLDGIGKSDIRRGKKDGFFNDNEISLSLK